MELLGTATTGVDNADGCGEGEAEEAAGAASSSPCCEAGWKIEESRTSEDAPVPVLEIPGTGEMEGEEDAAGAPRPYLRSYFSRIPSPRSGPLPPPAVAAAPAPWAETDAVAVVLEVDRAAAGGPFDPPAPNWGAVLPNAAIADSTDALPPVWVRLMCM